MIRMLLLISFCVAIGYGEPARADELTPEKKADIHKMMDMTGALSIGQQMVDQMVLQLTRNIRARRPDVPQKVIDALREEVSGIFAEHLPSLVEQTIPIYHKFFTHEEIKAMIQFYATELGQKLIRTLPSLMQESMSTGSQWGQSLGPELERRLKNRLLKEGIDLARAETAPDISAAGGLLARREINRL